jgi:hypothetical protein
MCEYEILVAEELAPCWQDWFGDVAITRVALACPGQPQATLLRGQFPDQAALFGLLALIRDLNLTLLALRRVESHR